ncbi:MAG: Gfo/Idh/MocA family oxidoreductase [Cyanobacteria bacterium J069]|nr:MAG: gfo/Idh/MocA family oxidoreductase [Cyanobacteria bacterium J069]
MVQGERDSPVGVVVLGIGRWGTHLLRNFLALPGVRVVAIADPNPDLLEAAIAQFALDTQRPAVATLTNWQAALGLAGVDAVAIATPASTHAELIRVALKQRLHVFVEKPLTLSAAVGRQLCELAAAQGRQLVVDHTYLFHPAVQRGQALIQQGRVGQLRYGYGIRTHLSPVRSDVDALWDLAIHDIAILNHWLGERPAQVQAWGTSWLSSPQAIAPDTGNPANSGSNPGLADLVWTRLLYPSGFEATLQVCWLNPDRQRRLSVMGDRGTLIFDELATDPLVRQAGALVLQDGRWVATDQERQAIAIESDEPLRRACQHFLDCVRRDRPSNLSSGAVGVDLVMVLEALAQSMAQNGAIVRVP